jgi:hypothetical protein
MTHLLYKKEEKEAVGSASREGAGGGKLLLQIDGGRGKLLELNDEGGGELSSCYKWMGEGRAPRADQWGRRRAQLLLQIDGGGRAPGADRWGRR